MTDNNSRTNREIILDGLRQYGKYQKQGSAGWVNVICPWHSDGGERTPSCGVRVAEPALGLVSCFGCTEAAGPWNKFAEKCGLEKITEANNVADVESVAVSRADEEHLLGDETLTFKSVMRIMNCPEAIPWPDNIEWRGYEGAFMQKLGAHIVFDRYNDSVAALFPVKVVGRLRGGVKAAYVKSKKKGQSSYITMSGTWIKDYGLFPFVYAKKLMRDLDSRFIVLVEGPRDAMRLCRLGIPAVCVLGSKNITRKKLSLVQALDPAMVYVMPDNDNAGAMMWRLVKELAPEDMKVRRIKLPTEKDDNGKLIKMDPGNAPIKLMRRFCKFLGQEHGFDLPVQLKKPAAS